MEIEGLSSTERKGRFGHREHPAEDFVEEVERIKELRKSSDRGTLLERIQQAMMFRVGGDERAVDAKHDLRQVENEVVASMRLDARQSRVRDLAIFLLARDENGPDFTADHQTWAAKVIDHVEGHHCDIPGTPSTCVPCVGDQYRKNAQGILDFLERRGS